MRIFSFPHIPITIQSNRLLNLNITKVIFFFLFLILNVFAFRNVYEIIIIIIIVTTLKSHYSIRTDDNRQIIKCYFSRRRIFRACKIHFHNADLILFVAHSSKRSRIIESRGDCRINCALSILSQRFSRRERGFTYFRQYIHYTQYLI